MRFRIIKKAKNEKERYELFYFNEYGRQGQTWEQVIWDEAAYCRFMDVNYETSLDAINLRAREFAKKYAEENGELISEFEIKNV